MTKMQLAAAGIVALGATVIGARGATAQATTAAIASPFHEGQWGVEGYAAGQTGGILRFFTPRTALVLDLSANRVNTSADRAGAGLIRNKATEIDATLGIRRHTMLAQHVAATIGVGAVGGSINQTLEYAFPAGTSKFHSSYFGAYLDAGGQYMVADHFAIGLAYRLTGRHVKSSGTGQSGSEFAMAFVPVRATLYF